MVARGGRRPATAAAAAALAKAKRSAPTRRVVAISQPCRPSLDPIRRKIHRARPWGALQGGRGSGHPRSRAHMRSNAHRRCCVKRAKRVPPFAPLSLSLCVPFRETHPVGGRRAGS
jgi:hypothetical protein